MKIVLLLLLAVVWAAMFPVWPYNQRWTYRPAILFSIWAVAVTVWLITVRL